VVGLLGFGSPPARAGNTINVSTASQLVTAVVGASAGDTIVMAPGNYAIKSALDVSVNVTVEGPTAAPGATINGGSMTNPSTIDSGQFDIFAVASGATLTLHDVTLTGTLQPSNGVVTIEGGGAASIGYAAISSNSSPGVDAEGPATITNSTITQSNGFDGIIDDGGVTLNEDTIANNSLRGIDNHGGGSATVYNTILSGNGTGNCYFAITVANGAGSNSDDSGSTCGSLITTGGAQNTGTGVIAASALNNGGPTSTYALPNGSVAIDHGTGTGAAADDQRHFPRDATPDIGAYEFGATAPGAKVTVKKIVVGGTAVPSDFTMTVTDTTTQSVIQSFPGSTSGTQVSVPAGDSYKVTESGAQTANYVESDSPGCTGTAVVGANVTCTVTNSETATLTVKKVVVGPGSPSSFTLTVTDTTTSAVLDSEPGSSSGHQVAVPVGDNYKVTESGAQTANYVESDGAGCTGTAVQNGTPSCTITNTAKASTLTVKKIVVGGTAIPSDFTMTVTDTTTQSVIQSFAGSSDGTQVPVPAGHSYTVTEAGNQTPSYNESNSAGCSGTATANGTLSCTVTNTVKPTILTVKKVVVGPGQPSDFTLTVTDTTTSIVLDQSPGSAAGKQVSVPAGDNYKVTESGAQTANYAESDSAGCTGTATVNGTATCTITNTAKPTTLTVTKVVVGGTAAPSDFTLTVTDTTTNAVLDASPGTSSGKQVAVPAGDNYKVTESGAQTSSYSESDSAGCTGAATANGAASCTITNTVKPAKLTVILKVVGSTLAPTKFSIHVKGGSPRPSSFHGSKSGTKVSLNGGSYSVSVGSKKGYKGKLASGCHGTLQPGGAATCRITETKQKKRH
jgi:hypothetical protein